MQEYSEKRKKKKIINSILSALIFCNVIQELMFMVQSWQRILKISTSQTKALQRFDCTSIYVKLSEGRKLFKLHIN